MPAHTTDSTFEEASNNLYYSTHVELLFVSVVCQRLYLLVCLFVGLFQLEIMNQQSVALLAALVLQLTLSMPVNTECAWSDRDWSLPVKDTTVSARFCQKLSGDSVCYESLSDLQWSMVPGALLY